MNESLCEIQRDFLQASGIVATIFYKGEIMKKTTLAATMAALLLLAGCDDQIGAQKLLEAEKTIVNLESQLKQTQQELTKAKNEIAQIQPELAKFKSALPGLKVEIETLFEADETLQFDEATKLEFDRDETSIAVSASVPKTQIEWLDQLLLLELYKINLAENASVPKQVSREQVIEQFSKAYQDLVKEAKEIKPIGLGMSVAGSYISQRNQLALFTLLYSDYSGGAHGTYFTRYLNVDLENKTLIQLNDLIPETNQEKVKELLWENYKNARLNHQGKYVGTVEQADLKLSENFYFSQDGVVFVYPPYELGSYAEGEIEVTLSWQEGYHLINEAYRLNEKDGFKLQPIENDAQ